MRYESEFSVEELISMGYIEEHIKQLVVSLKDNRVVTTGSCGGHEDGLKYPWVDFKLDSLDTIIKLLSEYKKGGNILIQIRNYDTGKLIRIFPYCKTLEEGRKVFNEFEKFLTQNKNV